MTQKNFEFIPDIILEEKICGKTRMEYVPHATERMKQRSITQEDIVSALKNPTQRGLPADVPHLRISWKKSKTKVLSVVYDLTKNTIRIITAYWLS